MSKIAEKKSEERFPLRKIDNGGIEAYYNAGQLNHRKVYIEAYDQAFKDFMEKAEELFYEQFNIHPHDCHVVQYVSDTPLEDIDDFVEQFKNYMQNEIQD